MKMKHTTLIIAALSAQVMADPAPQPRIPGIPQSRPHQQDDKGREERGEIPQSGRKEGIPGFRTIDGYGNHFKKPELGTPDRPFVRMFGPAYGDGKEIPAGAERPSARLVSNAVAAQEGDLPNRRGATDFLWQWGQFIDHDITETPTIDPPEPFDIPVPAGDPWFDPDSTGAETIPLNRSYYVSRNEVSEQVSGITAFIDASQVYGSDETRAEALKKPDGSGLMKTSSSAHGDLLPYNESNAENAPNTEPTWFLAGDIRANEQAALTAMHTLFVREHNYWANSFHEKHPEATGEEAYQHARMIVGAEIQHITYTEFLPILLGPHALPPYRGFREEVDPTVSNEFATAAFRFGHSLLPATVRRVGADGKTAESGDLNLADAFFDPGIVETDGIENLLRGLASQRCQELDTKVVDAVRNFLFGPPGSGGLDLAALNIQRGRDHGLPSYNEVRKRLGMRPARRFMEISPDPGVQAALGEAYEKPDDVDLWVGGLAEPPVPGAMVGPVFHRILTRQFARLRDGDRFYYEAALPPEALRFVRGQTLADIIRRNTGIGDELPDHVFLADDAGKPGHHHPRR
jgi:peroxidase